MFNRIIIIKNIKLRTEKMHIKPVMHLKQIIFMAGYQSSALHGAMKELLFSHSVVSDSLQPHGLWHPRLPLSFSISWSLLKPMSIKLVMPFNHLILCKVSDTTEHWSTVHFEYHWRINHSLAIHFFFFFFYFRNKNSITGICL